MVFLNVLFRKKLFGIYSQMPSRNVSYIIDISIYFLNNLGEKDVFEWHLDVFHVDSQLIRNVSGQNDPFLAR